MSGKTIKYSHIFWDWNGTLLDDVGAALDSVNDMLIRRGMKSISLEQYHDYIDTPIIKFYENIFDLEKMDYGEILKEYNAGYEKHLNGRGLTEGAREALDNFRSMGTAQLIVSSCEQNQLDFFTKQFGVEEYFDAVLGSSDFLAGSKLERAKIYLETTAVNPGKVLVIGDLLHDCDMAKYIGADCVLLCTGHQSEEKLKLGGVPVAKTIGQVLSLVSN